MSKKIEKNTAENKSPTKQARVSKSVRESVLEDAKKAEAGRKTIRIYEDIAKRTQAFEIATAMKKNEEPLEKIKLYTGLTDDEITEL